MNSSYRRIYFFIIISMVCIYSSVVQASGARLEARNSEQENLPGIDIGTSSSDESSAAEVSITARKINFGIIAPESVVRRLTVLRNGSESAINWALLIPEGWTPAEANVFSGSLPTGPNSIRLTLSSGKGSIRQETDGTLSKLHAVKLSLEINGTLASYERQYVAGSYAEPFKILLPGLTEALSIVFRVTDETPALQINEPPRIDFGAVAAGKQLSRQVRITNRMKEPIAWRFEIAGRGHREGQGIPPLRGKYASFMNENNKVVSVYVPPEYLKADITLTGRWIGYDGLPSAYGENNSLQYRFAGTGISVYLWQGPDCGRIAAYIDDKLVYVYDAGAPVKSRIELPIVAELPGGIHTLTLLNGRGRTIIEGVNILGRDVKKGPSGWIGVTPSTGTTARETDYVDIRLDTKQMAPGAYGEQIVLSSNRGETSIDVFVDIKSAEQTQKYYDIYRYVSNNTYLYTNDPQTEENRLKNGTYRKEGIAFRLFAPGTPGTTKFYRWYNSRTGDFYYTYDQQGGNKPLQGYVFEGSIGNIATSKLGNTKELYQWFNNKLGTHFYTTDEKGEGMPKKGYKFDGIAGYVK